MRFDPLKKMTKGEKTKQLLYNCALELFREKGYDNVSVSEIAKKAGTAKGTVYIYFESKAAFIAEMLREYDKYYDAVYAQMDPELSVTQKLESMILSSCRFTQDVIGVDLIRVLYANQLTPGQLEQDALNSSRTLYCVLHQLLCQGQQAGTYRADLDADEMVSWLVRCIRGTFYEWCMREGDFDLCQECLRFVRIFCRGLEARPAQI